jgi:hypothetical protein
MTYAFIKQLRRFELAHRHGGRGSQVAQHRRNSARLLEINEQAGRSQDAMKTNVIYYYYFVTHSGCRFFCCAARERYTTTNQDKTLTKKPQQSSYKHFNAG